MSKRIISLVFAFVFLCIISYLIFVTVNMSKEGLSQYIPANEYAKNDGNTGPCPLPGGSWRENCKGVNDKPWSNAGMKLTTRCTVDGRDQGKYDSIVRCGKKYKIHRGALTEEA